MSNGFSHISLIVKVTFIGPWTHHRNSFKLWDNCVGLFFWTFVKDWGCSIKYVGLSIFKCKYFFQYLDALYQKVSREKSGKYHGLLVTLYAEHSPKKLLPFLKASPSYPLQEALEVCEKQHLIEEQIYLLGNIVIIYPLNT